MAIVSMAQLKKLHSFDINTNLSKNEDGESIWINRDDNKVSVYSADFQLLKTITIPQINGLDILNFYHLSKGVLDEDDGWEYIATYYNSEKRAYSSMIYEEDGSLVQTLDGCSYLYVADVGDRHIAYYLHGADGTTEVFEVFGAPFSMNVDETNGNGSVETGAFPVPASSMVTLTYSLPDGMNESQMEVYNMSGQTMETIRIGSHFNSVNLNVSGYKPGVYVYSLGGVRKSFVVE